MRLQLEGAAQGFDGCVVLTFQDVRLRLGLEPRGIGGMGFELAGNQRFRF